LRVSRDEFLCGSTKHVRARVCAYECACVVAIDWIFLLLHFFAVLPRGHFFLFVIFNFITLPPKTVLRVTVLRGRDRRDLLPLLLALLLLLLGMVSAPRRKPTPRITVRRNR